MAFREIGASALGGVGCAVSPGAAMLRSGTAHRSTRGSVTEDLELGCRSRAGPARCLRPAARHCRRERLATREHFNGVGDAIRQKSRGWRGSPSGWTGSAGAAARLVWMRTGTGGL